MNDGSHFRREAFETAERYGVSGTGIQPNVDVKRGRDRLYSYAWVRAQPLELTERVESQVKIGTKKVEKKKGLFSKETILVDEPVYETRVEWRPTGKYSDTEIDMDDLARRITEVCNKYWADGWEVLKIIDTVDGRYDYKYQANGTAGIDNHCAGGGYSMSYGYSVTGGVVIIFKRREEALS